jgi:hypothetical protein
MEKKVKRRLSPSDIPTAAIILGLGLLSGGCATTFQETHFFKSESPKGEIPNFFRVQVSGSTSFTSARYLSGYFDEAVVNQYFNEIGQPDKGRLIPVAQAPKDGDSKPAGSNGGGSSSPNSNPPAAANSPVLVLLLSSNSDDISNQLGALAQSQEFTASLATLLASSRFDAATAAESRLSIDQARGHVLVTLGDQLVTGLPDSPTAQLVNTRLLEFVNQVGADLGAAAPFNTLDEAASWLRDNRARIRQGGGS